MKLALALNPHETDRTITGNRPTVFVKFEGHTAALRVEICSQGWDRIAPYIEPDLDWLIYLDNNSNVTKQLDEVLKMLDMFVEQWGDLK